MSSTQPAFRELNNTLRYFQDRIVQNSLIKQQRADQERRHQQMVSLRKKEQESSFFNSVYDRYERLYHSANSQEEADFHKQQIMDWRKTANPQQKRLLDGLIEAGPFSRKAQAIKEWQKNNPAPKITEAKTEYEHLSQIFAKSDHDIKFRNFNNKISGTGAGDRPLPLEDSIVTSYNGKMVVARRNLNTGAINAIPLDIAQYEPRAKELNRDVSEYVFSKGRVDKGSMPRIVEGGTLIINSYVEELGDKKLKYETRFVPHSNKLTSSQRKAHESRAKALKNINGMTEALVVAQEMGIDDFLGKDGPGDFNANEKKFTRRFFRMKENIEKANTDINRKEAKEALEEMLEETFKNEGVDTIVKVDSGLDIDEPWFPSVYGNNEIEISKDFKLSVLTGKMTRFKTKDGKHVHMMVDNNKNVWGPNDKDWNSIEQATQTIANMTYDEFNVQGLEKKGKGKPKGKAKKTSIAQRSKGYRDQGGIQRTIRSDMPKTKHEAMLELRKIKEVYSDMRKKRTGTIPKAMRERKKLLEDLLEYPTFGSASFAGMTEELK